MYTMYMYMCMCMCMCMCMYMIRCLAYVFLHLSVEVAWHAALGRGPCLCAAGLGPSFRLAEHWPRPLIISLCMKMVP